jgi:hypothetical protein
MPLKTAMNAIQNVASWRSSWTCVSALASRSASIFTTVRKMAPKAPTDADSVGVAMPPRIEPSTAMIRKIGGISAMITRRPRPAFSSAVITKGGQELRSCMPRMKTQTMYSAESISPGMNAPAKRSPTDTVVGAKLPSDSCACWLAPCRMSPMKISTVDGGMICPSVPEAQMIPVASLGS